MAVKFIKILSVHDSCQNSQKTSSRYVTVVSPSTDCHVCILQSAKIPHGEVYLSIRGPLKKQKHLFKMLTVIANCQYFNTNAVTSVYWDKRLSDSAPRSDKQPSLKWVLNMIKTVRNGSLSESFWQLGSVTDDPQETVVFEVLGEQRHANLFFKTLHASVWHSMTLSVQTSSVSVKLSAIDPVSQSSQLQRHLGGSQGWK